MKHRNAIAVLLALLLGFGLFISWRATSRVFGIDATTGRISPYPPWTVSHFVSAIAFLLLVPVQLWTSSRARQRHVHRLSGRVALGAGAVLNLSGVAIPFLVPGRPVEARIFFSFFFAAFGFFLVRGLRSARGGDVAAHRAWMIRAIAMAVTPMTQRLIFPFFVLAGSFANRTEFWMRFLTAAWVATVIDLAMAEWWVSRGRMRRRVMVEA